jgi:hypothetical protein
MTYEMLRNIFEPQVIDAQHIDRQRFWSRINFGPGLRTKGIIDHMKKEFVEIEKDPTDVREWVDLIILALDGAWRTGAQPQDIIDEIKYKQAKNETRKWPDWRTMPEDKAIEHIRSEE